MASITLPFTADPVPSALPSKGEIEDSMDVLSVHRDRKIVRVGRDFVMKYGLGVIITRILAPHFFGTVLPRLSTSCYEETSTGRTSLGAVSAALPSQ